MFRHVFLVVGIVILATSAEAQNTHTSDYRSIVPKDWVFLGPDGGGSRFVSPRRDAWMSLHAEPAQRGAIGAYLESLKDVQDGKITYQRRERNWIVVSGFKGDRIFYRKTMLACGNTQWHHLDFEYPASEKIAYDPFVTRASYALAGYEHVGCRH